MNEVSIIGLDTAKNVRTHTRAHPQSNFVVRTSRREHVEVQDLFIPDHLCVMRNIAGNHGKSSGFQPDCVVTDMKVDCPFQDVHDLLVRMAVGFWFMPGVQFVKRHGGTLSGEAFACHSGSNLCPFDAIPIDAVNIHDFILSTVLPRMISAAPARKDC